MHGEVIQKRLVVGVKYPTKSIRKFQRAACFVGVKYAAKKLN